MRYLPITMLGPLALATLLLSPGPAGGSPGTSERVSVSSAGRQGNDDSRLPAISTERRYVALTSFASNLVPGDTYDQDDVFAHERSGTLAFCGQRIATIIGTGGNDLLVGTAGPDVIHGLGDQDSIDGGGGNDVMDGGSGTDLCRGGSHVAGDSAVNCELIFGVP